MSNYQDQTSGQEQWVQAPGDEAPTPAPFRVDKLIYYLRKHWWILLVTILVCLAGGVTFALLKQPTYISTARMWETVKMRLPEGSYFSEDMQNFVGTQTELLQSTALRDLALERLRSSTNSISVPLGKDGRPVPVNVRASQMAKSSVFLLEAAGPNPAYTQGYLDALMQVYLEYKKNVRKVVSGDTLASISEQVQRTERDLQAEQDALAAFQRSNNLAVLQAGTAIDGAYLAKLKTDLSDLQLQDRVLKSVLVEQEAGRGAATANLDAVTLSGPANPGENPADRQVASKEVELLKAEQARLSKHLRPKHPKMVKLAADIERAQTVVDIYRRQNKEQLAMARQALQMKIDNVQSLIKEWETKVFDANNRIAEAERLKLNVQRVQQVYDRLTMLVQNVGISRNIDQETLSVLEPASLAVRSYSMEIAGLAGSAFGGLIIGLGVLMIMVVRDDRFLSSVELGEKVRCDVIGQVPEVEFTGAGIPMLMETGEDRHMYLESFRNLRSAVVYLAAEAARPRIIMITSSLPDEGKSTVAANLALTLAQGGARVLLVDGDLRKGVLYEAMGMEPEPGLTDLLQRPANAARIVQTNSLPTLNFIPAGAPITNPGDLFLGNNLDKLLAKWRKEFDFVLIDSTPVFAADDATTLAPKVDGTIFVVRSQFAGAQQVQTALELLNQRQARVLGLVLNRVEPTQRWYYYYRFIDYYHPAQEEFAGAVGRGTAGDYYDDQPRGATRVRVKKVRGRAPIRRIGVHGRKPRSK